MSAEEDIFKYGCSWSKKFKCLNTQKYHFYYFSLHYNSSPVYRLYTKKDRKSYDIYKYKNYWYVSSRFNFLDFKSIHDNSKKVNSIAPEVLPPKYGWQKKEFSEIFNDIMTRYHIQLALFDIRFDGWVYKHRKMTPLKMKKFFSTIIATLNSYYKKSNIFLPKELIYIILNNFRPIEFID